ncbi:MAG TPA: dNTP triphosphohydrolase [Sedimentisphaerales bacterium]|jgi:dGTPase|nr:dNTP triphosphohydrolase [Sedimentisphaerales bacterium]HNU28429.1 dNTP triphosphohydrolase [Sedimentisphaerales bacterium]
MVDDLRSFAVTEVVSKGRAFAEPAHPYRSDFERDRDRVIHSSAFRRLEGKTQVFTPGLDDYYRSRLTHSIEVAQIGRTLARTLGLNDTLTEAICLAHDLGHSPFGHAGESALNSLMAGHGGFEHNAQSLRIVDLLEHPYPQFMGLNLMYETRLGLAMHKSRYDLSEGGGFPELNCTLEGQAADLADRIAYNCHDLEDGMRARLLDPDSMRDIEIFAEAEHRVQARQIDDWTIRRTRTAKAIIDALVGDCIETSRANLAAAGIRTVAEVCARAENLISLSAESDRKLRVLEDFLLRCFYHHESLVETSRKVQGWLGELFERLCRRPEEMPGYFRRFIPQHGLERAVCDYIAGMTDRYCLKLLEDPDA